MLTFIDKACVFRCMDKGLHEELGWPQKDIHLKTWQDMAVYERIRGLEGKTIGEVGGGNSRILPKLAARNRCFNIDKFDGTHGGPKGAPAHEGVQNRNTYLGEFSAELSPGEFDLLFSVSVLEHVPLAQGGPFIEDSLRVLKPGGQAIHAIDLYVGMVRDPDTTWQKMIDLYRGWLERPDVVPLAAPTARDAVFHTSMASNPDQRMWLWNSYAPHLAKVRAERQSVSLLLAFSKAT